MSSKQEKPLVSAYGRHQTGHQTLWFYWTCPSCQTKVLSLGFPDDIGKIYECECHICRNVARVRL